MTSVASVICGSILASQHLTLRNQAALPDDAKPDVRVDFD